MGRKQIIKALEYCSQGNVVICSDCLYHKANEPCGIEHDALELIKELTEENERLNDELKKRPKKLVITKLNTEDENK